MNRRRIALAVVTVLAGATTAWASGDGEGFLGRHAVLLENLVALFNFAIFAYILIRFAGPPVRAMFSTGAAEYKAKVAEAARVLDQAKQVHAKWAERQAELERETADIRETAVKMAEVQAVEIVANAKVAAQRLIADVRRGAESELLRAGQDLRADLVDNVIDKAEEQLRSRLTPSHQKMLIEEAIKKLEAHQ